MTVPFKLYTLLYKLAYQLKNFLYKLFNITTLGVQALVVKGDKVLLVRHTYTEGWYLIGGGIESGESPIDAVKRELKEEVGILYRSAPFLLGYYLNRAQYRNDYVALYIVENFKNIPKVESMELQEIKWFEFNRLPQDLTSFARLGIRDYLNNLQRRTNLIR